MMPKAATEVLKIICVIGAFFQRILRKHRAGIITATSILRREPIKAITSPKKGRRKATETEETTSVVLRTIKHQKLLATPTGSSSSKLLANGFINSAYLVNGLTTVVHTASLEATACFGIFKVIWDKVL